MEIKVRDKTFRIDLVNHYSRGIYGELTDVSMELPDLYDELQAKAGSGHRAEVKEIRNTIKDSRNEIAELRNECVKELLESNGYEFDEKWWMRKTEPNDMNDFIFRLMKKDVADNAPKTKKK